MKESDFLRGYGERWKKQGGFFYKIPDAMGTRLPSGKIVSSGLRPFDAIAAYQGRAFAFEFKVQSGGMHFVVESHVRPHQLHGLREFSEQFEEIERVSGISSAWLVVGWIPMGTRHAILHEWSIQDISETSVLELSHEGVPALTKIFKF